MSTNTYGRQVVIAATNKSGDGLIAGDVCVIDTTNNLAFTTDTSGGFTGTVGIAQGTIANNAAGLFAISGYVSLVNVNASVTRGHYGKTYTVAKQATDAGASRGVGTFCEFTTGGTTPDAVMWPVDLLGSSLTNPMTTSQDIIVGGSSGTPTRLAKGVAGSFLGLSNGALAYLAGTSFPGSPATNDLYFRTDRSLLYYYDGTRWLTAEETPVDLGLVDALEGSNSAPSIYGVVDEGANGAYVTRAIAVTYQGTGDGSNFVTYQLASRSVGNTAHNLGSSFTTAADTASNFVRHSITIGAVVTSGDTSFRLAGTKTGSPTGMYAFGKVFYRLIG